MTDEETKAAQEAAKAVQEVAKATSQALGVVEGLGGFLREIFGPPFTEASGLFTDWIRFKRENFDRTRKRIEQILEDRGVRDHTEPISLKHGVAILEKAALEDDASIQDMWAGLLANSLDPGNRFRPTKLFIGMLGELEPLDVAVLNLLGSVGWEAIPGPHGDGYNLKRLSEALGAEEKHQKLSLLNLHRLGLLFDQVPDTWDRGNMSASGLRVHDEQATFQLTSLGYELFEACKH